MAPFYNNLKGEIFMNMQFLPSPHPHVLHPDSQGSNCHGFYVVYWDITAVISETINFIGLGESLIITMNNLI